MEADTNASANAAEAEANAVAAIITSSPTRRLPNTHCHQLVSAPTAAHPSLLHPHPHPLLLTVAAGLTANKTTVNGVWHHLLMQAALLAPLLPYCHAYAVQYVGPVRELAFKILDSGGRLKAKCETR